MSAPAPAIQLMENHDEALHVWRRAGVRDRVLVHVDAHHDMWWLDDVRHLSIANYICPALKDGLVREVHWVVPDRSFGSVAGRAAIERHVRKIVEGYRGDPASIESRQRGVRAVLLGRRFFVSTLQDLQPIAEPVLLDVDTDYLLIGRVTYGRRDAPADLPWCWPAELCERLAHKTLTWDNVTIAYSVVGGYTPIVWKYLGAELARRLTARAAGAPAEDHPMLAAFESMNAGAVAERRGDYAAAEAAYLSLGDALGAAPYFRLAYLSARQGRTEDGRRYVQRAIACDPSYRAPFVTPGMALHSARAYAAAERAFDEAVRLDPLDASAHVGLAWMSARRRRWPAAAEHARAAIAADRSLIDAHRALAEALEKQRRFEEAIPAYEESLRLALHGQRSFNGTIATASESGRLLDADHARTHARLARLYERAGEMKRAVAGYRIAIAAGYHDDALRKRLDRLQ